MLNIFDRIMLGLIFIKVSEVGIITGFLAIIFIILYVLVSEYLEEQNFKKEVEYIKDRVGD